MSNASRVPGGKIKILDLNLNATRDTVDLARWYFDISGVSGFERLKLENFSVTSLTISTYGNGYGAGFQVESYDNETGRLFIRHSGYLMCQKGTIRISV